MSSLAVSKFHFLESNSKQKKKVLIKRKKRNNRKIKKIRKSGKHKRVVQNIIRKATEEYDIDLLISLNQSKNPVGKLKKILVKITEKNKNSYKTSSKHFLIHKLHKMLEKRFKEGVRICKNGVLNARLIPVCLDKSFEPVNRVFNQNIFKDSQAEKITTSHSGAAKKKYGKPTTDGFARGEDKIGRAHV